LFLSSEDIVDLISKQDIDFVEDSSNKSTNYARNKIRLTVIPQLREINPNLDETFQHNIKRFADTELVLQQIVANLKAEILKEELGKVYLSIKKIKALNPQHLLLFELLRPFGFTESVVAELLEGLDKQSGTSFFSISHRMVINRQALIIDSIADRDIENKNLIIHSHDEHVRFLGSEILITSSEDIHFEKNSNKAFVDTNKLIFPLVLRSWQAGDKFKPIGMSRSKKLSDFFIDEKVPLSDKDLIPILVNGNGELIWIAGWRQDNRYKLTEATKNVTIFELRHLHITIPKQS
jgi:tRNA(Ile)-lysidine synthase